MFDSMQVRMEMFTGGKKIPQKQGLTAGSDAGAPGQVYV